MFKKFAVYDLAKYIFIIPLFSLIVYQYMVTKDAFLLNSLIFTAIVCLIYELAVYYFSNDDKLMDKADKGMHSVDEAEMLLIRNQAKLVNTALKNALDLNSDLNKQLECKSEELEVLREVSQVISSTFEIKTIVEYIYNIFNRFTKCDRYIICFANKDTNELVCKYEYGNYLLNDTGRVIGEEATTTISSFKSKQTVVRINVPMKHTGSYGDKVAFPLNVTGEIEGVIYIESLKPGCFLDINISFLESISNYFAVSLKSAELFNDIYYQKQEIEALYEETAAVNEELNSYILDLNKTKEELRDKNAELIEFYDEMQTGYIQTVMALANSIEAKDPYTRGHCQRVMEIACEIAKQMGFHENDIDDLRYAAILHDIGKIGISANILNKVGKLTDEEYNEIKKHPYIAYIILKDVKFIQNGLTAILQHHERYDGKGYPNGLKGEEISVFGRILCIADAFDAMTSDRPYRKGMTMNEAIIEIQNCKGAQFDPQIADIFINMSTDIVKVSTYGEN